MEPGHAIVSVSGRLTLGREVEQLETVVTDLLKKEQKKFVFDMTALDYLDSSGIGTVVSCLTQVKKSGGDLRLAGVNPRLLRMFKMTGVDGLVNIYPTVAEATAG
jgi:anti-sigma B factor antagonist